MIPAEKKARIIESYKKRLPVSQISQLYGVATCTVHRIINASGTEHRESPVYKKKIDVEEVRKLAQQGLSCPKMAAALECSPRYLWELCQKNHIETAGNRKIDLEEFRKMCEEGHIVDDIAAKFGINPGTAYKVARKNGFCIKRKPKTPKNPASSISLSTITTSTRALGIEPKSNPVKCTMAVMSKCYYGGSTCNFMKIEGRSRILLCSCKACTQFITHKDGKKLREERRNGSDN